MSFVHLVCFSRFFVNLPLIFHRFGAKPDTVNNGENIEDQGADAGNFTATRLKQDSARSINTLRVKILPIMLIYAHYVAQEPFDQE